MRKYFRFIIATLFFMGFVAYVIVSSNPKESTSWTQEDREGRIDSCVELGIGNKDLCDCVLNKLQLRYPSLEEMYKDPQEMAASMRSISIGCKK